MSNANLFPPVKIPAHEPARFPDQPNEFRHEIWKFHDRPDKFDDEPNQCRHQSKQFAHGKEKLHPQPNKFDDGKDKFPVRPNKFHDTERKFNHGKRKMPDKIMIFSGQIARIAGQMSCFGTDCLEIKQFAQAASDSATGTVRLRDHPALLAVIGECGPGFQSDSLPGELAGLFKWLAQSKVKY
jgi:hypothetical protein